MDCKDGPRILIVPWFFCVGVSMQTMEALGLRQWFLTKVALSDCRACPYAEEDKTLLGVLELQNQKLPVVI